jgi:hypothetical protein
MGESPLDFSVIQKLKSRYFAGNSHSKSGGARYGFAEVVSLSECRSGLVVLWSTTVSGLGCRVVTGAIDRSKGCVQQ